MEKGTKRLVCIMRFCGQASKKGRGMQKCREQGQESNPSTLAVVVTSQGETILKIMIETAESRVLGNHSSKFDPNRSDG